MLPGECEVSSQKCSPKTGKSAPPTTHKNVQTKYKYILVKSIQQKIERNRNNSLFIP